MHTMQTIINITPANNARNMAPRMETVRTMRAVGLIGNTISVVAEARWYMSRHGDGASPVYCSIWVHAPGACTSGHGRATGYGYHKESAALGTAMRSAGINGCGDGAMEGALLAIGRHVGATGLIVV
jgi:hypothetical protein